MAVQLVERALRRKQPIAFGRKSVIRLTYPKAGIANGRGGRTADLSIWSVKPRLRRAKSLGERIGGPRSGYHDLERT